MDTFKIDVDADGIALVTFDVPGRSMNTLTGQVMAELPQVVERIRTDAAIKGAVIASGKASGFCAGADLGEMGSASGPASPAEVFERVYAINRNFRALETCGKPVAAAIAGVAMGGGLELALACHHRVLVDDPKIQIGLPEAKVGLLPGGGGTQRLPRLMGVMAAAPYLLEGKSFRPSDAKSAGVVDQLVPRGEEVEAAKAWVKTGDPVARWDKKDFKIPGGGPYTKGAQQIFVMGNAMLRKQTYGNYPAQVNIMKAVYEGLQVPIEAALRIESRYFARTLMTPQAAGMIRTLFGSMQALGKGAVRPQGPAKSDPKKVAVIGAGMMGAGVAYVQAMAGIETVLIDQDQAAADKGKGYAEDLVKKAVSKGRMTSEKAEAVLALIRPTADYADVKGCDLVIEAVFENREIKAEVTRKAEAQLAPEAVFGSNTSTMGEQTGDEALAKAIDYVLKIKKTPIIVNDARGFYTSRCFGTFVQEGMEMLADGIAPAIIDNVGRMTGMPRGPLEMHDDVALDLSYKIAQQTQKDLGDKYQAPKFQPIMETMVAELGRYGRKNKKGFYDYPEGGRKRLWPGLQEVAHTTVGEAEPPLVAERKQRLLHRQAVEAARCFEEGVITDPREADVGAILGWGFAPWTGGVISYIDGIGTASFVEQLDALAQKHGDRFSPPQLLRDMAAKGDGFYDRFGSPGRKEAA